MTKKNFLNKSEFETKYNNGETLVYLKGNDGCTEYLFSNVIDEIKDMYDKQKVDELPFFTSEEDAVEYYTHLGESAPKNWEERLYKIN